MTTVGHRLGGASSAVLRWTRAAVIALMAALAVLVHHETAVAIAPVSPTVASDTSSLAGMLHAAAMTHSVHTNGHATSPGAPTTTTTTTTTDDHGACSGTVIQHCSAAGVDSVKFVPPHHLSISCAPALPSRAAVGRDVPGTTGRAPPDLSVLSRLLL
jgi:hypothetical protein